jgi:hypothetical protein
MNTVMKLRIPSSARNFFNYLRSFSSRNRLHGVSKIIGISPVHLQHITQGLVRSDMTSWASVM